MVVGPGGGAAVASCVFAHQASGDSAEFGLTGEAHGELEFSREHPEDALDAGLAEGGETPKWGTADEDGFSAEGKCFQDIAAAADAAIHEDRDFA